LKQFTVNQKQERRPGVPNADAVSFIQYVEVIIAKRVYRLMKKAGKVNVLLVDGARRNVPYAETKRGIRVISLGDNVIFTASFGLTIVWDGRQKAEVLLCDVYRRHVCGLCGNADGKKNNDFVDRRGRRVPLKGHEYTKYFNWGSKWRVPDETTKDSVFEIFSIRVFPPLFFAFIIISFFNKLE
jgi:hypothetical protein